MDLEIGTVLKYKGLFFSVRRKTPTQYVCEKIGEKGVEMRFKRSADGRYRAVGDTLWAKISSMEAIKP